MYNIAVVGAGQLGSRHLQGLLKLDLRCQYFVTDPSENSLKVTQSRVAELGMPENSFKITYTTTQSELPEHLDYVVVATTADVRLEVLKNLLGKHSVGNLLLEKVLFQYTDDYEVAAELIHKSGTKAWVNCPRRAFQIYQDVRNFFANQNLLHFHVHGGDWGLGCNSIHFLDLLEYLTDEAPSKLSTSGLDRSLIASKRENFYEFTGSLRGFSGAASFEITSLASSKARLMVLLRSEERTCLIDEAAGQAFFYDIRSPQSWLQKEFKSPLLSEQITSIARETLVNTCTSLTDFDKSVQIHLPLISALGAHAAEILRTSEDFCPIT
ncbi:Gfo/Idh/MocA family oxidoreductase [Chromobacterium haemolyticum]|uniref:Gfo/Idh/MocA family oxidoreductase n=1 Tax=Chromobacterium haemolyticum TaxID=394935 RepID=UPI0009F01BA4|nr:Gfo/Idh/MocA family oxidoreductase [Chromobacterium haemolyticum]OQS42507.1 hypothetical protein B0T39_05530 [Chromobacterium haemolyticum]